MPAQWTPLFLFGPAYQNVDETGTGDFSVKVTNAYIDEANHVRKRPGLKAWCELGTNAPVDGLFWWETQETLVALSDSRVWLINENGWPTEKSGAATFLKNMPATFTFDTNRAYMANGGSIVHFTKGGDLTNMADADAPTSVSHVAFLDQYILANIRNTGQWQFSEVLDGTAWRAVDLFTSESSPDNLQSLHTHQSEIVLIGTLNTEFWANDGVSPFSIIRGTNIGEGSASPYTFAILDRKRYWLTDKRRFIEIPEDKRQPNEVSLPVNAEFDALSDVSDARGFKCSIDGLSIYILTFPNANRTWAYNYQTKHWTEWDTWDLTRGLPTRWRGNNYAYAKAWNLHCVGDREVGKVYLASQAYKNDAGVMIRMRRRSGFIDHGTNEQKRSFAVRGRFRRAQQNADVAEPFFLLRWRNDTGAWGPYRQGSLGKEGDHDFYVTLYGLGAYRSRQWELVYTDDAGFIMNGFEELVDVIGFPGTTKTTTQEKVNA